MAPLEGHVLDVGPAGFADPQPVRTQQHSQRGVRVVEPLGGEQEATELASVQSAPLCRVHRRRRTYWAGSEEIRPSMCAKR